jgi:uncharacterized SAM-binding protein YcdF (DUF218 family)
MRRLLVRFVVLSLAIPSLHGCGKSPPDPAFGENRPLDAVLVLGCPAEDDGRLSGCQWQRAIWGHALWKDGVTEHFITSGNAVYNRYIEAEAMKAGMVALGVPEDVIWTETQALHTDENAAFALALMEVNGWETLGVASHPGHAQGARAMLRGWGQPTVALGMDMEYVVGQMNGLPDVRVEPVPEDEWLPLGKRERVIAKRLGRSKRPSSLFVYPWRALSGTFGTNRPPRPPVIEPTLGAARHRVDTAPWY